ncbi:phosducin-like protein 1 [Arctopsyche grandis]|uniref:phosducin-like protein 1 n=1 Tax=Arctopsyche grandis TaxID=121162 RepID=UPI00406D808F
MATLEDRILGEKTHYYCSSSEDEDDDDKSGSEGRSKAPAAPAPPPEQSINEWGGSATNTGPKGVLHDWQRFKQLEAESRADQELERLDLVKKLTLTCMTSQEEDQYKKQKELDDELDELLNDEILLNFQKQRMREMLAQAGRLPRFGKVIQLKSSDAFLDAIDKENKSVTVIIHLYEYVVEACQVMNGCLVALSQDYPCVKFCRMSSSLAGVSKKFKASGVPALLIYKAGQMIGNFVRITDVLGDDFFATDVESYLIEHGLLPDKSFVPEIVLSPQNKDEDSDVSLD